MATTPELALLALRVYSTTGAIDPNFPDIEKNRPAVPTGWIELEWHADQGDGFSYGVYRNGTEIVIAYAGTNQGIDWASNAAIGLGLGSTQVTKASIAYLQAQQQYGSNITFTGHSLGGGLASIMAVWFDRPAVLFDEAPFEATALNPIVMGAVAASVSLAGYSVPKLTEFLNNYTLIYAARESRVTNHYVEGEALAALRIAFPTVMGAGQDNVVNANISDMGGLAGSVDLHSQALLTAMVVSDAFRLATYVSSRVIPLLMDINFYAISTQSTAEENVLIKFIRSEQGTGDILTHFAADLQKLGTHIAGLTLASHAMIAQGIEWYYWQGTNYPNLPRQEFFIQTANLYQYTTAQGDHLEGARNKAASYVDQWLTPLLNANNAFGGNVNYDQWNVVAGDTGATATAKDPSKSQIYVGGGGADSFTGGNLGDILLAGAGNDSLNGGLGNDQLYGGAGQDSYLFSGAWGNDTLTDSDGSGSIRIGTASSPALTGGKKLLDNVWESDDHSIIYTLTGTAGNQNLIIGQRTTPSAATVSGTITVQGWVNGQLGITLDSAFAAQTPNIKLYNGGQHAPLVGTSYNWAATSGYDAAGNLIGGVAELNFADVIQGSAAADSIKGLGGNDALAGGAGDDRITRSIHMRAHWRSIKHYKNRSCSRYFLLGWRPKRHVKKSRHRLDAFGTHQSLKQEEVCV